MFGLVLKRTHREALRLWGKEEHAWRVNEGSLHKLLVEKDQLLNSTEREKVLVDLESALNLIQAYQRALGIGSLSDPNIIKANALLEKWGKKGDPQATYFGFQTQGKFSSKDLLRKIPDPTPVTEAPEFAFDPTSSKNRTEQEEDYWGDEAYGSATVRIEVAAVDEGDDKEPGYTRAQVRFVDIDTEPETTTAKEIGWSPFEES